MHVEPWWDALPHGTLSEHGSGHNQALAVDRLHAATPQQPEHKPEDGEHAHDHSLLTAPSLPSQAELEAEVRRLAQTYPDIRHLTHFRVHYAQHQVARWGQTIMPHMRVDVMLLLK